MTAQIPDRVTYKDTIFDLCGVKGVGLFDPYEHGLDPMSVNTACHRGYTCSYLVSDSHLYLDHLEMGFDRDRLNGGEPDPPPNLFGVAPRLDGNLGCCYTDIHEPMTYSGGLMLGHEFIVELYVHMGFQPAHKFRNVTELILVDGRIVNAIDRSREMADVRRRRGRAEWDGSNGLDEWINHTFSLIY